jgi:sorting nexin-4
MSQRNSLKPSCGCSIERALHRDENYIFITGAQKQSDSPSGKSYIAYHIRIGVSKVYSMT